MGEGVHILNFVLVSLVKETVHVLLSKFTISKAGVHSTSCITISIYVQACMQAIRTNDASTCPRPTLTAGLLDPSLSYANIHERSMQEPRNSRKRYGYFPFNSPASSKISNSSSIKQQTACEKLRNLMREKNKLFRRVQCHRE